MSIIASLFFFLIDIKSSSPASEDLIKKIGEVLKLKCDITGVPSPTFLWHKDGNKLPHTSPNLDVTFNNDASFGKYTCKASNIAGDRSVVFAIRKTCMFFTLLLFLHNLFVLQCFLTLLEILNPTRSIHTFIEPIIVGKMWLFSSNSKHM